MNKAVLTLLTAAIVPLAAQDAAPHFEVASIKPQAAPQLGPSGPSGFLPGGRVVARNMTADRLLVLAFREEGAGTGLRPEQIVGAPSWMASTMYSIEARVAGPATAERIVDPLAARLLRSLLEDRFKLKYHFEQRELPFYALLVDKADGSFGPNLQRSAFDCDAIAREREAARLANRPPTLPAAIPGRPLCSLGLSTGRASGSGVTMITVASMLTGAAGNNTVLDRTGLGGAFDLELRFAPEPLTAAAGAATDSDAPSLFTAAREQLGLKLERGREIRPVLVVDSVERPTPN
jgi:uncharacterized protein (TIGR03435 family)